jgi:CubicO group peptidase (beta-lactamase class C family)
MRRCACMILALIVLLTGFGGSSFPAPVQAQSLDWQAVDTFMTDLMALYDIPGAGIAIVQNGEVLYTQGYGTRNTETGEPVTPNTQFAIGSVTKSFTALDISQLVDEGRVNLDAPVITYLPDFKLSDPVATQTVTVRDLLAQTTGLPGTDDFAWYSGRITNLKQAVDYVAHVNLAAEPGSVHIYDNYNYAIAGYLIEQVTGQTWEDYTREHILQPLGMTGADFDTQTMQQRPDYASPHILDILRGMQPCPFVSLQGIASAGAINASAREMANYLVFQLGDGTFNGTRLVSAALLNEMHTQQIAFPPMPPIGPTGFQSQGYAMGWMTAGFHGYPVLWHNGSIDGFYTMVMFMPSENVGVAVLSNAGLGTGSLFTLAASLWVLQRIVGITSDRDVVEALNEEAAFDPADRQAKLEAARAYQANPADWGPLIGEYSSSIGPMRVEERDGKLYLDIEQGFGMQSLELVPFEPNGFLIANLPTEGLINVFMFSTDSSGTVTLSQQGVKIGQKAS